MLQRGLFNRYPQRAWPTSGTARPRRLRARGSAGGIRLVVDGGEDGVIFEAVSAFEKGEFDQEINLGNGAPEFGDQRGGGHRRPAGGEEVIDNDDVVAFGERVNVHLSGLAAIFERVTGANSFPG